MKALRDYSDAWLDLGEYWDEAEIKLATIAKGSSEAQKWAADNIDLIKNGEWDVGQLFASESRINRYAQSISSSFMGSVNALRLYIDGAEKAGLSQQELTKAIEKADPVLAEYINTHEKADLSIGNYIWQTKKASIQTGLFTAGISLGTAALGLFAQKGNTTAAQVVGGLTAVGGAIAGVVGAIQLAKGALSLTTGFGIISAGISAVIAGINAYQTASARMREAWQADINQLEQFKQSSEELTEAYTNVSKYLTALRNGEDVSDDLNDAVTTLNKALGDNKVKFDEASMSAEEYAKRVAKSTKEALKGSREKVLESRISAEKALDNLSLIHI